MNITQSFLTKNECYIRNKSHTVKGIMVHSTGANNPYLKRYIQPDDGLLGVNNNGNHWNQYNPDGRQVCVHAFIGMLDDGTIATYQTLPWDIVGWHSGSGSKGSANYMGYVGFEICESILDDSSYFNKVYDEAANLVAFLCAKYNLDPLQDGVIICHSEGNTLGIASAHADVMHWFPLHNKDMDDFRQDVYNLMSNSMGEDGDDDLVRYNKLSDIPNNYGQRDIVNTLMRAGIVNGDGSDPTGNDDVIDMSIDQLRTLIWIYNGGGFDKQLEAVGLNPVVD